MIPRCPDCGGQIGAFVNEDEPICICALAHRWRNAYRAIKVGTVLVYAAVVGHLYGICAFIYDSWISSQLLSALDYKRPETLARSEQQLAALRPLALSAYLALTLASFFVMVGMLLRMAGRYYAYRPGDAGRWFDAFWPKP